MKKILLALMLIASVATIAQQPAQTFTLDGSGSSDPESPTQLSYQWRLISGPGTVTITNASKAIATVTGVLKVGTYIFELTVTDPQGLSNSKRTNVFVTPNPDTPPAVNAGNDQTVQLSATVNKITLLGSFNDAQGNGTVNFVQWTIISGPNTPTITSPGTVLTDITNIVAGLYKFRLKVGDNGGASAADTVQVTVKAANQAPVADAGPDQTITLPVSSVFIGKPDPIGLTVQWIKLSGPSGAIIVNPTSSITEVKNLKRGYYIFRKTTRNDSGLTASSDVAVRVKKNVFSVTGSKI